MDNTGLYAALINFSEEIDKVRSKYMYCFSDHSILADINKINTKFSEIKEAYSEIIARYINLIKSIKKSITTIEWLYFRSLIYNILKGNLTILMANYFVETNMVITVDVDAYCEELIYENEKVDN